MANSVRVLGIITARGGSKGVPGKNVKELLGHPLIHYTISAAKESKRLTRCIVSTDSEQIAAVARSCGADVPFLRPDELATDSALALDVLKHAIQTIEQTDGQRFDYVMMLHPTSPLRTAADIDACIALAEQTGADSVFSMKKIPDFAPEKLKIIDDNGEIQPFLGDEKGQSQPRTKGRDVYKRNCAIYLTKTELILKGDQFGKKSMAYVMPEERSIDINEHSDLSLAEFWMKKLHLQQQV